MKIGELARATRTTAETIRYYERSGLLDAPPRSEGNYRIYTPTHVERLSFIRHCRNLDMTLDEIRVLLRFQQEPLQNCAQINDLLDEHIAHVAARIRELQALEIQLHALRETCREARQVCECGILRTLQQHAARQDADTVTPTSSASHVHGTHGLGGH